MIKVYKLANGIHFLIFHKYSYVKWCPYFWDVHTDILMGKAASVSNWVPIGESG